MNTQTISLKGLEMKVENFSDNINQLIESISIKSVQFDKAVIARTKMNVLLHDKSLSNLQLKAIDVEISKIDELSDNCLSNIASLEAEKTSIIFEANDAEAAVCQFISTYGNDYSIIIAA